MRVSGWSRFCGLRGGHDESDTKPKAAESEDCDGSPTLSATDGSDEHSEEDGASCMDYGEEGEDLSDALDEELARLDSIEDGGLALPPDGYFLEVVDEIETNDEEEDFIMEDASSANITLRRGVI